MADEPGAIPDPAAPPAVAPGATPPAPPAVPFDKDIAMRDYIERQVEKRVDDRLNRIQAAQPRPDNGNGKDPLDVIAEELAAEEKLDPAAAKSIVNKFRRIVEHTTRDLRGDVTNNKLTQKFSQVFGKYDDAQDIAPIMTETFKSLTELERNFVLNAPDGADWLYQKARSRSSRAALPPSVRVAAGAPPARGASLDSKLNGTTTLFGKANELLRKGDRAGYEEVMTQINRG